MNLQDALVTIVAYGELKTTGQPVPPYLQAQAELARRALDEACELVLDAQQPPAETGGCAGLAH